MKIVEETGGARIGLRNASWPFARLTLSKKELRLSVKLIGRYSFAPTDIDKLEVIRLIPLLGKGIRIHHNRKDYPGKIIFWTLNDPQAIRQAIVDSAFMRG